MTGTEENPPREQTPQEKAKAIHAEYLDGIKGAETRFGQKLKKLLSQETIKESVLLAGLELVPFLGPYSLADVIVAGDGILDICYSIIETDLSTMERATSIVKGILKVGIAAAPTPFMPWSGIKPTLDVLMPTGRNKPEPAQVR